MDHYFTDNRHLAENRREISSWSWCSNVSFIADNGMFSKDSVDFGTRVPLNTPHEHEGELGNQPLDMGCGYGVVGVVTKKAWPDKQVEMVDANPRTVELARDNAEKNDTGANIHVSDAYEQVSGSAFTGIITNPPIRAGKNVIYNTFEEAWSHLADQGILWVMIREQQRTRSAVTKIKEVFGDCDVIHKERGYFTPEVKKALIV